MTSPILPQFGQKPPFQKSRQSVDPVIDSLIGEQVVAHRPKFARAFGGVTTGLLLSQFWFYSSMLTAIARDGWFYAPQSQIEEDTGLTRTEQETARRNLRALGVLSENKAGIPAKLWYQIDKDRVIEQLREFLVKDALEKQSKNTEKLLRAGVADKDAENLQTAMSESCNQEEGKHASRNAASPHTTSESPLRITKKTLKTPTAQDSSYFLSEEESARQKERLMAAFAASAKSEDGGK